MACSDFALGTCMTREHKEIFQHYSAEDHALLDKSLELIQRVEDTYSLEVTSFINPHQAKILESLANKYQLQTFVSSDYFPSEWVRVIIAPSYYQLDKEDFDLTLLEIVYPSKFQQLTHSQIFGTLMNRLGLDRRTFGDILVEKDRAQVLVDKRFTQFFIDHISKIAKTPVKLKEVGFERLLRVQEAQVSKEILASSMRLDKLIASSFKLSRNDASQLIFGKHVKVNYSIIDNPSYLVGLNDLISVRRFGRFKIVKENGFSKNGKHKLTIQIQSSK